MIGEIVVLGGINMDLVTNAEVLPKPGETIKGYKFGMYPGGKGSNQAVAIGKLGGKVSILGRVGDDNFGETLRESMESSGVNTEFINISHDQSTGIALIMVDKQGENMITFVPGANGDVSPEDVKKAEDLIGNVSIFLAQLEVPYDAVFEAVDIAYRNKVTVIIDPAPVPPEKFPSEFWKKVSIVTPNEVEAEGLTGIKVIDIESAKKAGEILLSWGIEKAVVKLGAKGCVYVSSNEWRYIESVKVDSVDSTAAGDVFAGALSFSLARGDDMLKALQFANYAGALSTTKYGAQPGAPTYEELMNFMREKGLSL